ncbi:MAG: hypothetical protein HOV81_11040 [Kofleriaceae bacterium]|nr:hypothetical protein [Kofleriaceae bacterium]
MWTLVVCCLVAVGGARPQLDVRDPYASQTPRLDAAPTQVLALATRRDTAHAPDFRLPPFVLSAPTSIGSPARTAVTCEPRVLVPRIAPVVAACSARGPPVS